MTADEFEKRVTAELKAAIIARDVQQVRVIREVKGALDKAAIAGRLSDGELATVIKDEVTSLLDAAKEKRRWQGDEAAALQLEADAAAVGAYLKVIDPHL